MGIVIKGDKKMKDIEIFFNVNGKLGYCQTSYFEIVEMINQHFDITNIYYEGKIVVIDQLARILDQENRR